jgi:hypothetical protein
MALRTEGSGVAGAGTEQPGTSARRRYLVNPVATASQVVLGSRGAAHSAPAGAWDPDREVWIPASPAEASLAALPVDRAKAVRS